MEIEELFEALEIIKDFCFETNQNCGECPLYLVEERRCMVGRPIDWSDIYE